MDAVSGAAEPQRPSSTAELAERLDAERAGIPFLIYRDDTGAQIIVALDTSLKSLSIGRGPASTLRLGWDSNVSRTHAEIVQVGEDWTLTDDGLSRNGSFINGERVTGRRRLRDGDVVRVGLTKLQFRAPEDRGNTTSFAQEFLTAAQLSPAQRRVLVALARPYATESGLATPATNQQIASELFLSVDAVKTHLRSLAAKFGVQELPQNQKRVKLVERALASGIITKRDLADPARG